ncbi:MAG: hypothetical protein E7B29_08045, partial [Mixta calida]|nr:hypothetical protein [Mixta calida]
IVSAMTTIATIVNLFYLRVRAWRRHPFFFNLLSESAPSIPDKKIFLFLPLESACRCPYLLSHEAGSRISPAFIPK